MHCSLGPEKQLTNETLETIVNRRREWLELPEHEKYNTSRNIAEKSFEYISDGIENIQELHGVMSYHLTCYRSFTDITKLERARKIAASLICKESGPVYVTNTVRIS